MKKMLFAAFALVGLANTSPVLTWVSPYSMSEGLVILQDNPEFINHITHLGLQLWNPTSTGGLTYAPLGASGVTPSDSDIQSFVSIAHPKVKVWLTVYNNSETTGTWDWSLAKSIISNASYRSAFVDNLVAEVARLGLDGVDLDLEGTTSSMTVSSADALNYYKLVRELRAKLPADKEINVDTFHYKYNSPNWTNWVKLIENGATYVTSMGYADLGWNAPTCDPVGTWCQYDDQMNQIGATHKNRLIIGVPAWVSTWQGGDVQYNLAGLASLNGPGAGMWELSNMPSQTGWLAPSMYAEADKIKALPSPSSVALSSFAVSSASNSSIKASSATSAIYKVGAQNELFIQNISAQSIAFSGVKGIYKVEMTDVSGKKVLSQNLNHTEFSQKHSLSQNTLKTGIYLLSITDPQSHIQSQRVAIQ